jgi:hypothetical protein
MKAACEQQYDVVYEWVAFSHFDQSMKLHDTAKAAAGALRPGGLAFVVEPRAMREPLQAPGLRLLQAEVVETLPSFHMHRAILPNAHLKAGSRCFTPRRCDDP